MLVYSISLGIYFQVSPCLCKSSAPLLELWELLSAYHVPGTALNVLRVLLNPHYDPMGYILLISSYRQEKLDQEEK